MHDPQIVQRVFESDTADHVMTVLHEDGLYRHIRFARPDGSSLYRYDLITWPGYLSIVGDVGDFTFRRLADMVEFFASGRGINPSYWAEKATGTRAALYETDVDAARQQVTERYDGWVTDRGLMKADPVGATWARLVDLMEDFEGGPEAIAHALGEWGCWDGLDLRDYWDWNLDCLTWRFLYVCHAIRAGVDRYRGGGPTRSAIAGPAPSTTRPVITITPGSVL